MGGHAWGMGMEGGEYCQTMCQSLENMYCGESEIFHFDLVYDLTITFLIFRVLRDHLDFFCVVFVW